MVKRGGRSTRTARRLHRRRRSCAPAPYYAIGGLDVVPPRSQPDVIVKCMQMRQKFAIADHIAELVLDLHSSLLAL